MTLELHKRCLDEGTYVLIKEKDDEESYEERITIIVMLRTRF